MKPTTPFPAIVPVFPLSGALLLPRGHLPLNIFEPRYKKMVEDAVAGNRMIAMIQPREGAKDAAGDDLYLIGCVGHIAEIEATEDGRFLINLEGVSRFRVADEIDCATPYRQIKADYGGFRADTAPAGQTDIERERLIETLRVYLELRDFEADWDALTQVPDETLVNSIAMLCPFEAAEKQALLEAPDLAERAAVLIALLEFDLMAHREGDDMPVHKH